MAPTQEPRTSQPTPRLTNAAAFAQLAQGKQPSLVAELWQFLKESKKWWLLPIVAALLILGALVALSTTPFAPFIYTLF